MIAFRAAGVPGERIPQMLAPERLSILQASAKHHARRIAHRVIDPSTDISDISQSLFLAALRRIGRFDPRRASWSTFVDLLVEHAAWDLTRQRLQHRRHLGGSFDDPSLSDAILNRAVADGPDPAFARAEKALDVERAIEDLPEHLRGLCRLLELEPPSVAQRTSGLSQAEFYRQITEIRMRFRAYGLYQWATS
jgi:DNA-directed RNA polymerase specialized sigma24 family protein